MNSVSKPLRWDMEPHIYEKQIKLDERYENISVSLKIRIPLYEPQKKALAAMYRLEQRGELSITKKNYPNFSRYLYKTHWGILSNPLGSGKTLTVLALIATVPVPPARPLRVQYAISPTYKMRDPNWIPSVYDHDICIRKKVDEVIRPALIISGRPALKQWLYAIETQTVLRAFLIENVYHLKEFCEMLETGSINLYDAIIVKNGKVGGHVTIDKILAKKDLESINAGTTKELCSMISNIMRNRCFSRLIIDDFDQIGLPKTMGEIPALFTWGISSTAKYHKREQKWNCNICRISRAQMRTITNKPYDIVSIESMLYRSYTTLEILYRSRILFSNFNICCTDKYVTDTIHIGKPDCYVYTIKNPDDILIAALGAVGNQKTAEIFEMLNADAIDEAANKAGIVTSSTKDIFQKILDDSYDLWEKARQILRFIKNATTSESKNARLPLHDYDLLPEEDRTYGKYNLRSLKPIKYNYPNINIILMEERNYWSNIKAEHGKSIKRIQNNLQANECAVCNRHLTQHSIEDAEAEDDDLNDFMAEMMGDDYTEFDDSEPEESKSVIMMKYCGSILCATCGISGSNFRMARVYKGKRYNTEILAGLCANCKREIIFSDLIFLNKDFDHDKIIMEKIGDEDEKVEIEETVPGSETHHTKNKQRTKIDVLLDIIYGKIPIEQKKLNKHIPNIMIGTANLPKPPPENIKVLIFANFDETLNKIKNRLDQEKIRYIKLGGTADNIHKTAVEFNTSTTLNILLVNSVKYCASLNLQMATDCVFMHKILDKNIESQVSGRAQRLGRKYNLRIHFIAYDNEMQYI